MKNYRAGKSAKTLTLFETKMAKVDALFLTIMAKKSICSLCSHHFRKYEQV